MNEKDIILEFRRAFRKLNYARSKLTVNDICKWTHTWCTKNNVPQNFYYDFRELAFAYAYTELYENTIPRALRKVQ